MKQLKELLFNIDHTLHGSDQVGVSHLTCDSRTVTEGSCFFAIEGTSVDGHNYIGKAVEAGASVIVCRHLPENFDTTRTSAVVVKDTDKAMAEIAAAYHDHPSRKMKVVGVTGTNGKTTIATLLYDLVRLLGHKAGLISTVVYKIDEREVTSTHTTPDAIRLQAMMHEMVECGCRYCKFNGRLRALARKNGVDQAAAE